MYFHDCISAAAMSVVERDAPNHLLPLLIANQAALLAGDLPAPSDAEDWH